MDTKEFASLLGGVLLTLAYYLASKGVKRPILLGAMNATGAALFLVMNLITQTWSGVAFQAMWIGIAIRDFFKRKPRPFERRLQEERRRLPDENGRPLGRLALLDQMFEAETQLRAQGVNVDALRAG